MLTEAKTKKRTRKQVTRKAPEKREPNIVAKKTANGEMVCPRCNTPGHIFHRYTSSSGRKQYTCTSQQCMDGRLRGRGFVVLECGKTYPKAH